MHYLLYKHLTGATYSGSIEKDMTIQEFTPKPFRLFADWEKQKDLATFIFRTYTLSVKQDYSVSLIIMVGYGTPRM